MEFTPKTHILEPEKTELSPFKVYIQAQFTVFLIVCPALFLDIIISFYSSFDGKIKCESPRTSRRRI